MPSRGQQLGKLLNTSGDIVETSLPPKIETFSQSVSETGKIEATALGDDVSTIEQVSDINSLSASGNTVGDQRVVGNNLYIWNGSGWFRIALINQTPTWDSGGQPSGSYVLDADSPQDATTITLAASDPDGFPISYSYVTSGSMDSMATISQDSSVFTITPKTVTQVGEGVELTGSITFRASDGINILPQISSFTLSFVTVVENSRYTRLLVTAVDTSDNNDITDSSTNNHTITVTGDAHTGTFSPYRHGGYSGSFDGYEDRLEFATSTSLNFIGGAFTIEAWVYLTDSSTYRIITSQDNGAGNGVVHQFKILTDRTINFAWWTDSSRSSVVGFTSTSSINLNQWHHVAISYDTSTLYCFIDGVAAGTANVSTMYSASYQLVISGFQGTQFTTNGNWAGNIADLRIVKGTALYTSAFTPPTERLTAISGTSLLMFNGLSPFKDVSTNNNTYTKSGNPVIEPRGPFDNSEYKAANNGGSIYFDGTGDRLSIAHSTELQLGTTSAFTAEFWVYIPTTNANYSVLLGKGLNTGTAEWYLELMADGAIDLFLSNNGTDYNYLKGPVTGVLEQNTWHHIAFVRENTSTIKVYTNGVQSYSNTSVSDWNIDTGIAQVGGYFDGSTTFSSNTYLTDVRIVKGTAVYTSDFTPPTAPLTAITNTSLLLSGTDASIIDKSQGSNLQLIGNTTGSTTEVKFADTKSMYFDGTGDYVETLEIASSSIWTIETWFNASRNYVGSGHFDRIWSHGTTLGSSLLINLNQTNGAPTYRLNDTIKITSSSGISLNTWYHLALVSDGTNTNMYLDGTNVGTAAGATILPSRVFRIGTMDGTQGFFNGYIQDLRITKGLARYTANFTPPTEPFKG